MCRFQNKKVLDKAFEEYEKCLREAILPIDEKELKNIHFDGKKLGSKFLAKNLIGSDSSIFEEFKAGIHEKYENLKLQNQYELKMHFMTYLKDQYNKLDFAIKSGEFANISSFEKSLKIVEKEYYETCLDGQIKGEIFLTFAREIANKFSDFLIVGLNNEIKLQKLAANDLSTKYLSEIKELNDSLLSQKISYEKTISALQMDLNLSIIRENELKDQNLKLISLKEDLENNIKETVKAKNLEIEGYKKKILEFESQIKETARKHTLNISEIEEKNALLIQQLDFTQKSLDEYKAKEKNFSDKLKDMRSENAQSLKTLQNKYEQQIEKLSEKTEEKTKENNELENEIELKEGLLEETQSLLNGIKQEYFVYKEKTEKELQDLQKFCKEKEILFEKTLEKKEQEFKTATARMRARLSETEKKNRNNEELRRSDMAIWAQDNAILVQKIEFLEQEVEELKIKREEEKKHYRSVINTMETVVPNN